MSEGASNDKRFHRSGGASRGRTHSEARPGGRRHAALGTACVDIAVRTHDGSVSVSVSATVTEHCSIALWLFSVPEAVCLWSVGVVRFSVSGQGLT